MNLNLAVITFTPAHNVVLSGIIAFICFIVFLKANNLYLKSRNASMAVISNGFLFAGFYELLHIGYAYIYNYINHFNEYRILEFLYLTLSNVFLSASILIAVFYGIQTPREKSPEFRRKSFFLMGLIFIISIFLITILSLLETSIFNNYINKIVMNNPASEIVHNALYILAAITLIDVQKLAGKKPVSKFLIALLILGIAQLYTVNSEYLVSPYRFYVHFAKIAGLTLLFFSLKEIDFWLPVFSLRPKFSVYPSLFLLFSFLIFTSINSIFIGFIFPSYAIYILFIIFLISIVIQYILSSSLLRPLSNLINGFKEFKTTQKPVPIPVTSKDEIGILTLNFNGTTKAVWESENKLKESRNRERLLREISTTIRSSLDINETLKIICDEVARLFNVQRATIVEFPNPDNYLEYKVRREYTVRADVKGLNSIEYDKRAAAYWAENMLGKNINIIIDNIEESDTPEYFKKSYKSLGVKSLMGVPVRKDNDKWGTIVLSEYDHYRHWTDNEISLLEAIGDKVYIAIKQAEFYTVTKQQAEREATLRRIISAIRSSLDINDVLHVICEETARLINADIVMIIEYPDKNNLSNYYIRQAYFPPGKVRTPHETEVDPRTLEFWAKECLLKNIPIKYDNITLSNAPDYLKTTFKNFETKSNICIPIQKGEDRWGMISIALANPRYWTQDEINLLSSIADQVYLAIRQSELFSTIKQNADREKLLREIATDLKVSENPEDIFNYILPKISSIYNANRILFIEIPKTRYEKPLIKFEFLNNDCPSLKESESQESCIDMIYKMLIDSKSVIINNTLEYQSKNSKLQDFFKRYCLRSILISPLISYNHDVKILGAFSVTSNIQRNWTESEVKLLENISGIVVTVLRDVKRRKELDELRNAFILTLAHDLQMPLVGERTTLEFLRSRHDSIDKYYEILDELIRDNKNTYDLLSRLIHSYNYESGRQKLYKTKNSMELLVNEIINTKNESAQLKSITINTEIQQNLPEIDVDKDEIKTVIDNLLDNAIKYSFKNGIIKIIVKQLDNSISTCISDNGPGIPIDARERIFERYGMAQTIVRRFGSGLGLYLSKQIVEAHGGRIWYSTELGKGTTFCFSIPEG